MRLLVIGIMLVLSSRCFGESGCFSSVAEAARRAGVRDEGGFRAEGVRRDPLSGVEWVRVMRCGRPEVPWVLVRGVKVVDAHSDHDAAAPASSSRPLVVAGDAVRVVWKEGAVKGELAGVAMVSGAAGARVRVRVESFDKTDAARFVAGVVTTRGLVELEVGQ